MVRRPFRNGQIRRGPDLRENPVDGLWPSDEHAQFITEYKRMVDHLCDHPCIVVWNPFNEAWGPA